MLNWLHPLSGVEVYVITSGGLGACVCLVNCALGQGAFKLLSKCRPGVSSWYCTESTKLIWSATTNYYHSITSAMAKKSKNKQREGERFSMILCQRYGQWSHTWLVQRNHDWTPSQHHTTEARPRPKEDTELKKSFVPGFACQMDCRCYIAPSCECIFLYVFSVMYQSPVQCSLAFTVGAPGYALAPLHSCSDEQLKFVKCPFVTALTLCHLACD